MTEAVIAKFLLYNFLQNLAQLVKKLGDFMETEDLLPYS
jgi:hypothetical protein